jgi:hypothetical protein
MTDSERALRIRSNAKAQSLEPKDLDYVVRAIIDADLTILRYDDEERIERIKPKLEAIRSKRSWTELALMVECFVNSMRTPFDERIVFTNAFFIGELRILNESCNKPCRQLAWHVRILRCDSSTLQTTWPSLLQITPRRFYEEDWGEPEDAFQGVCLLVADKDKKIVAVEPYLEERI